MLYKSRVGLWKFLQEKGATKKGSFYVGDAAGRIKDKQIDVGKKNVDIAHGPWPVDASKKI